MELLLIRHALPLRVELTEGRADPALADDGHAQATRLAEYLASERIDAVYTSPLRRAVETAEPVARAHGLEVVPCPGVAEWDQNSPEYVPVEELRATNDPRWQALLDGHWESDEPEPDFHARVHATIEQVVAAHQGERVAIACHGGVINSYLARILGLTGVATRGFFYPNYTSIHRVAAASTGERSVVTLNETAHLRGTGLPVGLFQR